MRAANSSDRAQALCQERWYGKLSIWLSLITLLALVLRMVRVDFQPLWWDEGWSVYFATTDILTMIARTAVDIHPPFYYLVLHLWTQLLGSSAVSVRFFSVVVGTLSIPMIFLVGRRLFGVRVGLMVALTMALAPFHIYYSQEARMYALVTLLVLVSVYLFLCLVEGEEDASSSWVHWLLYIVVTSMAMYTQYYAAFVPVLQTIFVLVWLRRRRSFLIKWLGAQAVLLLVYLPWLLYAGGQLVAYVSTKMVKEGDVPLGLWAYSQQHLLAFSAGHLSESRAFLSWLSLAFIALLALGMVGHFRLRGGLGSDGSRKTYGMAFTLLYLLIPLCLGCLVNLRYPFTSPGIQRLFLLSAPAFYLLVALGLAWLWERFHAVWPACVLLLVVTAPPLLDLYTVERCVGEDYRPLIEKVQALAHPDDVIVAVHPWQIGYFHAYYRGQLPSLYLTPKEATDVTSEKWATDPGLMRQELDALLAQRRFLWFPGHQALGRLLEGDVEAYLSQAHYPLLSQWFSESTRLTCHTGRAEPLPVDGRTNFGDKLSLLGYGLTPTPVGAAWGAVLADLRWKIGGDLDGRYQVSLRLTDEEGRTWASRDSEPAGGLRPFHDEAVGSEMSDHHGLLIPAGTPPGSYQLRLGLYRLEDGRWLDILDSTGAPRGVEAVLGTVEVLTPVSPPTVAALFIEHPQQADFASGVRFLGYSLKGKSFKPGDALEMTLFWEALANLHEDYHFSLRLEDDQGQTLAVEKAPPAGAAYPTSRWTKGELVRGIHSLLIPANVPSNVYRLVLSLHSSADGRSVPLRGWGLNQGDRHLLATVEVRGRPHRTEPPASIEHPMSLRLGEAVRFLGYDLDRQEIHPGESLHLTLYWQAVSEMDTSYTVFNHLIDGGNRIWGHEDSIPGGGTLPTSSWIEGEYVVDVHEIPIRDDAPPGQYLIETGMYDLATMIRLPVLDAQGTVIGDRILLEATPIHLQ